MSEEKGNVSCMDTEIMPRKGRRGLKPGQKHSGSFKKGYDSRRSVGGGHDPVKLEFNARAREIGADALEYLEELILDQDASHRDRKSAAELVISHAVGLPVSRVLMATADTSGGNAQALTKEQLDQRVLALLGKESQAEELNPLSRCEVVGEVTDD